MDSHLRENPKEPMRHHRISHYANEYPRNNSSTDPLNQSLDL